MKVADIRKLKTEELTVQANSLREEIANLKRGVVIGEISNARLVRAKRKDLARVLTVLSEQIAKENI